VFYSYKQHCLGDSPCNHFKGTKRDGYGEIIYFDLIKCSYKEKR